jgi:hypothetical protein
MKSFAMLFAQIGLKIAQKFDIQFNFEYISLSFFADVCILSASLDLCKNLMFMCLASRPQ